MILAAVMPLPQARHLRDQVALDYAYDEDASGRAASSSSAAASSESLPRFNVNPYHGLVESFGEGSYDSDLSLSESSYEEITQAAIRAARREMRRQRTRHARSHNLRLFAGALPQIPEWENPCGGSYNAESESSGDSSGQGRVIKRKVSLMKASSKRNALLIGYSPFQYLESLRNVARSEYQDISRRANQEYVNFHYWPHEYKFLPNMTKPTSAVSSLDGRQKRTCSALGGADQFPLIPHLHALPPS